MKKVISLILALAMVMSLGISALAAENPSSAFSSVSYTGEGIESYSVTVPASMEPGDASTVKVVGTWASNRKLAITAPETVTLTNSIDGSEKELAVTFDGISECGDNTTEKTYTGTIEVEDIENALFGTWAGAVEYTVSVKDLTLEDILSNPNECEGYASISAPSGMNLVLRKYYYESRDADLNDYTEYDESVMTELGTPDYRGNNYTASYSSGGYAALAVHDATGTYAGEVWLCGYISRFMFCE